MPSKKLSLVPQELTTNPEPYAGLSIEQMRFVIARAECSSDKDAAERIGLDRNTIVRWKREGADLDGAVKHLLADAMHFTAELRRKHLAKAMAVKVAGLDSKDERLRQQVATEIIEWEMGKAMQRSERTNKGPIFDLDQWQRMRAERLAKVTKTITVEEIC